MLPQEGWSFQARGFVVWQYTISHRTLMIRSPKTPAEQTIDILFSSVTYVDVPIFFNGLEISLADPEEIQGLNHRLPITRESWFPVGSDHWYALVTGEKRFYVCAGSIEVLWSDRSYSESPLDDEPFPVE